MKRVYILLLLFLCLAAASLQAQTHILRGVISDSTGGTMPGTTVVLMDAVDSALVKFGLTNGEGAFNFPGIKNGKYILQLSYLGYQNYMLPLEIKPEDPEVRDLGKINLQEKSVELGGVVIEADIVPIVFKKDTIEYNADAFRVQEGDKVEDLLRKMPGMEVDAEGNVTAHGEKVEKVLVDGKEFFGDDAKMATRNLPAKAVDKVQVYDRKSDASTFTGVDDGTRVRTINLKLKDDYKQGLFGNAEGGVGGDETLDPLRWKGRISVNSFKKNTQLSVLGVANNINEQGFSFQDYIDFMGGMASSMRSMGGNNNNGINFLTNLNNGNVTSGGGGLNFNWTPSNDTRFSANYLYSGIRNVAHRDLNKVNLFESGSFNTVETNEQFSESMSHRLNLQFDQNIDSMQGLTFKATGRYQDGTNTTDDIRQNLLANGSLLNSTTAAFDSKGDSWAGTGNAQYKRKFHKVGRSVIVEGNVEVSEEDNTGTLDSRYLVYNYDSAFSIDTTTVIQDQVKANDKLKYSGKVNYTEPIGARSYLEANIGHNYTLNSNQKLFYDRDGLGGSALNETLSNAYDNSYTTEKAGLSFQTGGEKGRLTLALDGEYAHLRGNLVTQDTVIEKTFVNPLPSIRYQYQFAQSKRLNFSYSTNMQEPTAQQLSPLIDNSDPTRLSTGNPNLRAEYVHTGRLNYFHFDRFTFINIFGRLNGTYTQNKIVDAVSFDSNFVQIIRPVNVARDIRVNANAGINVPIKPIGIKVNVDAGASYNRGMVYVNSVRSDIDRTTLSGNLILSNRTKTKLDVNVGIRLSQTMTAYAVNENLNQSYMTQTLFGDFTWDVTPKWTINSSFNGSLYAGAAFDDQQFVPVWNAYIMRYLLPNNRMQIKLYAFDILNKNSGITRTADVNYVQEEVYRTLTRYVMLSVGYSLQGFQKQNTGMGPGGGPMMR